MMSCRWFHSRTMIHASLFAVLCLMSITAVAQNEELKNGIIEQRIEDIAGTLDEGTELDYTNLFEVLSYYFEHPLNLNSANAEELRELYLLTDVQITSLQRHLENFGSLRSIYELQAIENFDLETIRNISYFVTVKPTLSFKDFSFKTFSKELRHDMFLRYKRTLEEQAGYIPDAETGKPAFVGSPDYMYLRYTAQYRKNFRAGFTLEKDPGESLQDGPDFRSFHVMYAGNTWLRKVVVGDFQALFGQGITFWNGLAFGKSPFVLNIKKNPLGLRQYSSVQEGNFLRGAGATIGFGKFELTSFYSNKKIDAGVSLVADSTFSDDEVITSIPLGGLHRTDGEINQRNRLQETIYGGNLKYTRGSFSAGFTAVRTEFNFPSAWDGDLYQRFDFTGYDNLTAGLDYQAVIRNTNFFGEISRSQNGGVSWMNGLVASLHQNLALSAVYRDYDRDYQNLRTNAFGENNTSASNEQGLFVGFQAALTSKITLNAYTDLVKFPWLAYRVDAPSDMSDYLAQLNYKPDKKHSFYLRYRRKTKEQNSSDEDLLITYPVNTLQENWRIHGVYQVHPNLQLKTRAEWVTFKKENNKESGFLIYQDLVFKKVGSKMSFTGRYALFDTQSWNSKLYAFETDVLYAFSILPYAYKGSRLYGMIKWDVKRGIDLWIRYGTWIFTDRNQISSGNTAIAGNTKSDVHIQLRIQF